MHPVSSLIYREKLVGQASRKKRYIEYLIFLLIYIMFTSGINQSMGGELLAYKHIDGWGTVLFFFVMLLPLFGGIMAAYPGPVERQDRVSGWTRFAYTLPVSAKDHAMAKVWLALVNSVFYIACNLLYTVVALRHLDINILIFVINFFSFGFAICIGAMILAKWSKIMARRGKHPKIVEVVTGILIFVAFCLHMMVGPMPMDDFLWRFTTFQTLGLFALLLPAVCVLYYWTLREAYMVREA